MPRLSASTTPSQLMMAPSVLAIIPSAGTKPGEKKLLDGFMPGTEMPAGSSRLVAGSTVDTGLPAFAAIADRRPRLFGSAPVRQPHQERNRGVEILETAKTVPLVPARVIVEALAVIGEIHDRAVRQAIDDDAG